MKNNEGRRIRCHESFSEVFVMANTTFCDLKEKEIINICDGARLGCICDLEIDDCTGQICSIVVPGPTRFLGIIKNSEELVIPFCKIQKIGDDVILVDISTSIIK